MKTKVSIVIPLFNEEEIISELQKRLSKVVSDLKKKDYGVEVIFINDGSKDKTFELLSTFVKKEKNYTLIDFSRNFGHQYAVSCGIEHSTGDCIMIMDADLQDPPELIDKFLEKWEEGYKVVYAIRASRKESPIKKLFYKTYYYILQKLSDVYIPRDTGDFSLIDKRIREEIMKMPERRRFLRGLRAYIGFKQIGIEYDRDARFAGQTKYSLDKLVRLALDGLVSFSEKPVRQIFFIGVYTIFLSIVYLLLYLLLLLFQIAKPDLSHFIIFLLGLTSGINFCFLGVIGIYISTILDETKSRPHYIISDIVKSEV